MNYDCMRSACSQCATHVPAEALFHKKPYFSERRLFVFFNKVKGAIRVLFQFFSTFVLIIKMFYSQTKKIER